MALSTIQQRLLGILTPTAPAAGASIYDQARYDAQKAAMARFGMGLVAAAVPQTPAMRAQSLAQAFGSIGNTANEAYNMAQIKLAEQKTLQEQEANARAGQLLQQYLGGGQATGPRQVTVTPTAGTVTDGGYQRAGNVTPVQATLVRPMPPSTSPSPKLTQAQIETVLAIEASEGKAAALKKAAEFSYENSKPREPLSEMGQTVADLEAMGEKPEVIESVRQAMLFGKPDGVLAILTDPRWKKPEFAAVRQAMLDAEVAKLKGQGQPEFLKLIDAYKAMPEGDEKKLLRAKLDKEAAPNGMRIEFDDQGRVIGVVQGSAPGSTSSDRTVFSTFMTDASAARKVALSAVEDINTNNELRAIVDEGVRFGNAGQFFNAISTELQNMGFVESDDPAANTQAFANLAAKKSVEILSSGALGSGTGISGKDLEFINQMSLANPASYTPDQVKRILDIQDKINRRVISSYNTNFGETAKKLSEQAQDPNTKVILQGYIIAPPAAPTPPTPTPRYNPDGTRAN